MKTTSSEEALHQRARDLGLYGVLEHWQHFRDEPWLEDLLTREETERKRRSLERRIRASKVGGFKDIADFDYDWPSEIDREQITDLFTFDFLNDLSNIVLIGPNGVGKTMIAKNLVYQALHRGVTARFVTASEMLNDLAAQETASTLQRRIAHYCRPVLLAVDELGYLSYDLRHADLLFEIVSRRYRNKPILITSNRVFSDWNEVFPNATCVVTLVDRLTHYADIVKIDGESYRHKEAQEQAKKKAQLRAQRRRAKSKKK